MSKESVKELFGKIEKNEGLKNGYLQLIKAYQEEMEKAFDIKLIEFGKKSGFDFTAEDIAAAFMELEKSGKENAELSNDDLAKVAGGCYPTVQILQAAMAHRESIRRSFESQRATLAEAIEAQRRAITEAVNNSR